MRMLTWICEFLTDRRMRVGVIIYKRAVPEVE